MILKVKMVVLYLGFSIWLGFGTSILDPHIASTSSYQLIIHTAKIERYSSFKFSLHKNGQDINPGSLELNLTAYHWARSPLPLGTVVCHMESNFRFVLILILLGFFSFFFNICIFFNSVLGSSKEIIKKLENIFLEQKIDELHKTLGVVFWREKWCKKSVAFAPIISKKEEI